MVSIPIPSVPRMTHAEIVGLFAGYDPLTLAAWWAALAQYRWPEDFPVPKPEGFDAGCSKAELTSGFFDALSPLVAPEDASRAYWVDVLRGRPDAKTEMEWEMWWDAAEAAKAPACQME